MIVNAKQNSSGFDQVLGLNSRWMAKNTEWLSVVVILYDYRGHRCVHLAAAIRRSKYSRLKEKHRQRNDTPIWHSDPVNPGWHAHEYPLNLSLHIPCMHGLLAHSSTSAMEPQYTNTAQIYYKSTWSTFLCSVIGRWCTSSRDTKNTLCLY